MIFLFFCSQHRSFLGLHICKEGEGRKDLFCPIVKYCPTLPDQVDFDFSCQAKEYIDNREPELFANTMVKLEPVHGLKHKCGEMFKHSKLYLEIKT